MAKSDNIDLIFVVNFGTKIVTEIWLTVFREAVFTSIDNHSLATVFAFSDFISLLIGAVFREALVLTLTSKTISKEISGRLCLHLPAAYIVVVHFNSSQLCQFVHYYSHLFTINC